MSLKQITIQVTGISDLSELLPFIIYLSAGKKAQEYGLLGFFLGYLLLLKITTIITALEGINNMPVFHALAIIELVVLFVFYDRLLYPTHSRIHWLWLLLGLNAVDTLFLEGIYTFNSFSWSLNTCVLLLLGLLYYYRLYQRAEEIAIENYPYFYINAGFLIYAAGSLFTYLLAWKLMSRPVQSFFQIGWLIHSVANIIKNLAVGYGLWLAKQE